MVQTAGAQIEIPGWILAFVLGPPNNAQFFGRPPLATEERALALEALATEGVYPVFDGERVTVAKVK